MNRNIVIDISGAADKKELHRIIRDACGFPAYYGGNLDALYDCLTEFGTGSAVTFTGAEEADERLGGYVTAMKRVCAEAVIRTPGLNIVFEEKTETSAEDEENEADTVHVLAARREKGWSHRHLTAAQRKMMSKYRGNIRKLWRI